MLDAVAGDDDSGNNDENACYMYVTLNVWL